jgi:hypothetical protein
LAAEIDHLQLEQLKMRLAIVERPLHFLTHYAVIYVVSPTVFFWLTVEKEADVAAVKAKALKALTRNGLKIDQAGVKESTSAFAGIDSTESVYSAIADNGQPRRSGLSRSATTASFGSRNGARRQPSTSTPQR